MNEIFQPGNVCVCAEKSEVKLQSKMNINRVQREKFVRLNVGRCYIKARRDNRRKLNFKNLAAQSFLKLKA